MGATLLRNDYYTCYAVTNDRGISVAQTNATRQAAYRQRHLHDDDGTGERLNVVIDLHAKRALERLASCYGVTQRAILERVLATAEQEALTKSARFPRGQDDYYDKKLQLTNVTP